MTDDFKRGVLVGLAMLYPNGVNHERLREAFEALRKHWNLPEQPVDDETTREIGYTIGYFRKPLN
jgi:hypothetical protein